MTHFFGRIDGELGAILGGLSGGQRVEDLLGDGENALGLNLGRVGAILDGFGLGKVARRLRQNGVDVGQRRDGVVDATRQVRDLCSFLFAFLMR